MAMTVGVGNSKIGFDTDGKLKVSENGGAVTEVAKVSTNITGTAAGITGKTTPAGSLVGDTDTQALSNKTLASPTMTGTVTVPTQAAGDNSTKAASTAFVQAVDTCPAWLTTVRGTGNTAFLTTSNKATVYGVLLYCRIVTTQVTYYVSTADNTANNYDIGLFDTSGAVVAHIGPTPGTTFAPSTGWKTLNWTASATLAPGRYFVGFTTNCTGACAQMAGDSPVSTFTFYSSGGIGGANVTAGGTLSNIAAPVMDMTSMNGGVSMPAWYIH